MPKIKEMYAFLAEEGSEDEGVAAQLVHGTWLPLVGADMARVESLKGIAQNIANLTGKYIKIAKFSVRTDIGRINPDGASRDNIRVKVEENGSRA